MIKEKLFWLARLERQFLFGTYVDVIIQPSLVMDTICYMLIVQSTDEYTVVLLSMVKTGLILFLICIH